MFSLLRPKNKIALDLYISNKELLLNGMSETATVQIKQLLEQLALEIKNTIQLNLPLQRYNIKEKNYGYGADWTVALIEYVANSDLLKAIATTGGLITFAKHIVNIFKKSNKIQENNIYIGINTAKFFAIKYVSEEIEIENIEFLDSFEIGRGDTGFAKKEFLFILGINKHNLSVQDKFNADRDYNGTIFTIHISWSGELKSLYRY